MRSIIAAAVLTVLLSASGALADNDVGCGVGTEVWKGQKGLGPKLLASFTNAVTFQSISITFSLLNCNGQDTVTAAAELRRFAATNLDRIAREMATGGGESVDALAFLMGVPEPSRDAFAALAQGHFGELFVGDRATAGDMLDALERLMAEDPQLAPYARS
jgi:hypothetical protein